MWEDPPWAGAMSRHRDRELHGPAALHADRVCRSGIEVSVVPPGIGLRGVIFAVVGISTSTPLWKCTLGAIYSRYIPRAGLIGLELLQSSCLCADIADLHLKSLSGNTIQTSYSKSKNKQAKKKPNPEDRCLLSKYQLLSESQLLNHLV